MNVKLALALFNFFNTIFRLIEEQRWYQQGKNAYAAEQKAEQDARVKKAQEAINAPPSPGPDGDPDELP